MKRFASPLLVLASLLACQNGKREGDAKSLDRIKASGVLRVGLEATYPPMEYVEGGAITGFDVDFARKLAERLGVKAEFVNVGWDEIFEGLNGRKYDLIISSMNVTPDRAKIVDFAEYTRMSQVYVCRKGVTVKTEQDLAGKSVIAQLGTTAEDWLQLVRERVKGIKIVRTFKSGPELFAQVKAGKADCLIADEPVGKYYAKMSPDQLEVTGEAIASEPVGIALRKKEADLKAAVEKAVASLQAEGTVKALGEKWFGGELGQTKGLDRVKAAGKLVVAIDATYPPMEYMEKGQTVGFEVEYARKLGEKLGVQVEFANVAWTEILDGLMQSRYDVILSSMNITAERAKMVDFVEYAKMAQVFVCRKDVTVKSEADLAGKTVIVKLGTTSEEWLQGARERVSGIKVVRTFKSVPELFAQIKAGKGDCLVTDEPVGRWYTRKDPEAFAVTGQVMKPEPVGIAVRKSETDLRDALAKAVADLKADGTFKGLCEKWFGGELGQ